MLGPDPRALTAAAQKSAADAAQKAAAAQQLRDAARDLLGHVSGYQNLLQPVNEVNTPQTWRCPYGQAKTDQITGWQRALSGGVQVLLDRHAQWLQIADSIDNQAGALRSQAAQQHAQAQHAQAQQAQAQQAHQPAGTP